MEEKPIVVNFRLDIRRQFLSSIQRTRVKTLSFKISGLNALSRLLISGRQV